MVNFYFNQVRRLLAVMVVCLMAANASATPYKNIHILLQPNAEGRGKVYIKTEVPGNEDMVRSRKGEQADVKVTIGENGTDLSRTEEVAPDMPKNLRGFYMAGLFGEPEDGYKLAGFSLVLKADEEYTTADLLVPASTDSNGFSDPFIEDGGLCFNANCDRNEDARSDDSAFSNDDKDDNVQAYEAAQALDNWNEEPDHVIYAVFVPEGYTIPEGAGIKNVQSDAKAGQAYLLNGIKANNGKGVVIVNGKKKVSFPGKS